MADTKEKRERKLSVAVEGKVLTFTFTHPNTQPLVCDTELLTAEIRERAAMHGFEQKLRDPAAGCSPEEAKGLIQKVWDNLCIGVWATKREAGAAAPEEAHDLLARAVVAACERLKIAAPTFEAALAKIQGMSRAERAALKQGQVLIELARLKAAGVKESGADPNATLKNFVS